MTRVDPKFLPTLANCFRGPVLRALLLNGFSPYLQEALVGSGIVESLGGKATIGDALEQLFLHLRRFYRSDYVYRAAVVSKIFLGRHSPETTTLLSELRVDTCKADLVMLNGTSTVYEIKTARDNTKRLSAQLAAYLRMFDKIFVMADRCHLDSILAIASPRVGILELTPAFTIRTVRSAITNADYVDPGVIFDALRQDEWIEVTRTLVGHIPDVKPLELFDSCRELIVKVQPRVVHDIMVQVLKRRKQLRRPDFDAVPECLAAAFLESSITPKEWPRLRHVLDTAIIASN